MINSTGRSQRCARFTPGLSRAAPALSTSAGAATTRARGDSGRRTREPSSRRARLGILPPPALVKTTTKPPVTRLGVWIFGAFGGLATTLVVGTRAIARGLAKPIGLLTETAVGEGIGWQA